MTRPLFTAKLPIAKQVFTATPLVFLAGMAVGVGVMKYRRLGNSGLQVSELSFGAWVTFAQQIGEKTAEKLMTIAYDSGVNFFDNAEAYANGKAEVMMGRILKRRGWGRDTFLVSSKVFWGRFAKSGRT
jgi:aryl-alcohol dehydrogenase-like predicted oxidoreductase